MWKSMGHYLCQTTFLCLSVVLFVADSGGDVSRPRGVALSQASLYQPGRDFQCLDGSQSIKFDAINDDFCDCSDGSDEPGTSACSNGIFTCTNAGHRPKYLSSSWVNDGICDCCDGTDEYDGQVTCGDYCKELGRQAREDAEKRRIIEEQGYKIYLDYVQKGKQAKAEKKEELVKLEEQREELQKKRDDLEVIKDDAEAPEKEAKTKHEEAWKAQRDYAQAQVERARMQEAFTDMDISADGLLEVAEMLNHPEFDIDNNGEVSPEEAKEYLEDNDEVDFDTFSENVWPNIKEIFKSQQESLFPKEQPEGVTPPPGAEPSEIPPPPTDENIDPPPGVDEDEYKYYDDEDEEDMEREDPSDIDGDGFYDGDMPEYDEDTKKLIATADDARKAFNTADEEFKKADREVKDIHTFLGLDLGANDEFFPLRGECYEFTDSQYTYKLCPYDRATQRPKNGGSETNLGLWGKFDGPQDNRFSVMKMERGQGCWQGPDRSVKVLVSCGTENQLLAASEPSRCEYEFKFTTPAVCSSPPQPEPKNPDRDEL